MSQHGCPERLSNRSKGFQEDGSSQPTMEVLVETLTGTAFEMTVSPSDTIFAIKSKIFRVEGIPVSQQHILYNLKELDDASSLLEHAISDGARLRLVLGMRVGPISTRRIPPPANAEPWRDIERLLDSNRDEAEWCSGSGCRVTVMVLREGDRINLLRVRQNNDGTYSPLDNNKYSSALTLVDQELDEDVAGSVHENEVTMGKMLDLRRRMESLSVQRRRVRTDDKAEIQKTRSEETLSVPSLLDEAQSEPFARTFAAYSEAEDTFAPLYDGNYTRYDYDCSLADTYTLLPPLDWTVTPNLPHIGTRTDSEQSVQEAADNERLKLSDALAGSILVQGGRRERHEEAAILEECLDDGRVRERSPQLAADNLAAIPAAEFGPLVCGEASSTGGSTWRTAWGSSSQLPSTTRPPHSRPRHLPTSHSHSHSASSLHSLHALHSLHSLHSLQTLAAPLRPAHATPRHPPLSDALFSSSTSDLEKLKRNSRILPALSRHRNREHLHLSDEGLDLAARPAPAPPRSLEVGSERRLRRAAQARREADLCISHPHATPEDLPPPPQLRADPVPTGDEKEATTAAASPLPGEQRPSRSRCSWCRKRVSIATVHRCRCGRQFCAPHRYAEVHGCAYDYRAPPTAAPATALAAPKLPKI